MISHMNTTRLVICCGLFFSLVFHSQTLFSSPKPPPALNQVKSPCVTAEEYEKTGQHEKAKDEYEKVLNDKKSTKKDVSCAQDGLNQQAEQRCDNAKLFVASGRFNEAIANYDSIQHYEHLSKHSDISCAINGIKEAKKLRCEDKVMLLNLKIGDVAIDLYKKLISDKESKDNSEENIACVTNGLRKLNEVQKDNKINVLNTLVEFGLEDKATDQLKTYLEDDPTFLETDLASDKKSQHLLNTLRPGGSIWTEIRKTRVDNFPRFFDKLPSLIMEMSIIEAFVWLCLISLGINKFLRSPTLEIKDFKVDVSEQEQYGNSFATELEHQIIDLSIDGSASHNVFMVSGSTESVAPDFGKALASPSKLIEFATLLVPKLIARRSLEVNGLIQIDPKNDNNNTGTTISRVTVEITYGNRIVAKHALLAKDFSCKESNYSENLTICAAVWIIFMLQSKPVQWSEIVVSFVNRIRNKAPTKILGTSDWEAYAWFALGNKYGQTDMLSKAEAAYLKSLSIDPLFLASRVNLAGIYSLLADKKRTTGFCAKKDIEKLQHLAIQQLQIVECEEENGELKMDDPIHYTWLFRRAMLNFERKQAAQDQMCPKDWTDPSNDAEKLVDRIRKRPWHLWFSNPCFNEYLNWRYPVAECMRLGLQTLSAHMADEAGLEKISKDLTIRMDSYSLYNLACTYALFASFFENHQNEDKRITWQDECFNVLEKSLDILKTEEALDPKTFKYYRAIARAKNDHSFKALWTDPRFLNLVPTTSSRSSTDRDGAILGLP